MHRFKVSSIFLFIIGLIFFIIGFVVYWDSNPTVNWINNQPAPRYFSICKYICNIGNTYNAWWNCYACILNQYDLEAITSIE